MQRLRKSRAEASSLLGCYAEMQQIFCKDTKSFYNTQQKRHFSRIMMYLRLKILDISNKNKSFQDDVLSRTVSFLSFPLIIAVVFIP